MSVWKAGAGAGGGQRRRGGREARRERAAQAPLRAELGHERAQPAVQALRRVLHGERERPGGRGPGADHAAQRRHVRVDDARGARVQHGRLRRHGARAARLAHHLRGGERRGAPVAGQVLEERGRQQRAQLLVLRHLAAGARGGAGGRRVALLLGRGGGVALGRRAAAGLGRDKVRRLVGHGALRHDAEPAGQAVHGERVAQRAVQLLAGAHGPGQRAAARGPARGAAGPGAVVVVAAVGRRRRRRLHALLAWHLLNLSRRNKRCSMPAVCRGLFLSGGLLGVHAVCCRHLLCGYGADLTLSMRSVSGRQVLGDGRRLLACAVPCVPGRHIRNHDGQQRLDPVCELPERHLLGCNGPDLEHLQQLRCRHLLGFFSSRRCRAYSVHAVPGRNVVEHPCTHKRRRNMHPVRCRHCQSECRWRVCLGLRAVYGGHLCSQLRRDGIHLVRPVQSWHVQHNIRRHSGRHVHQLRGGHLLQRCGRYGLDAVRAVRRRHVLACRRLGLRALSRGLVVSLGQPCVGRRLHALRRGHGAERNRPDNEHVRAVLVRHLLHRGPGQL